MTVNRRWPEYGFSVPSVAWMAIGNGISALAKFMLQCDMKLAFQASSPKLSKGRPSGWPFFARWSAPPRARPYCLQVPIMFSFMAHPIGLEPMRKPTTIEHLYLDFDGFFASVEQLRDPHLRGRRLA
jgi:hypothetical protein